MANVQEKTNKESATVSKLDMVKSVAWLVESTFRGFVGWVLLDNFHNYVTTAAAVYSLVTAGVIVVTHFVKAHKA